MQMFISSA